MRIYHRKPTFCNCSYSLHRGCWGFESLSAQDFQSVRSIYRWCPFSAPKGAPENRDQQVYCPMCKTETWTAKLTVTSSWHNSAKSTIIVARENCSKWRWRLQCFPANGGLPERVVPTGGSGLNTSPTSKGTPIPLLPVLVK